MMCPASRTLLAAAAAGMVVASIFANDVAGWTVAILVGIVVHLIQRRRPELASCALPGSQRPGTVQNGVDADRTTDLAQGPAHDTAGSMPSSPER